MLIEDYIGPRYPAKEINRKI